MSLLRDDLLNPLPGGTQGENLEYDPLYDKIKEAGQEEADDTNKGDWQRTRKKADVGAVIKLAASALATRSKDLQLAVWLAEALVRKEGFAAFSDGFNLLRELQVRFWDSLYPELEDGNPQFRVTSQEWFARRCDHLLRRIPLTQKGLNWLNYYDAYDTARERAAVIGLGTDNRDDQRRSARDQAVALRENAAKEFKQAFDTTPKTFYAEALCHLQAGQQALAALEVFCEEKYGKTAPNFIKLREALEEIRQVVNDLLDKKREKEPDKVPKAENAVPEETSAQGKEPTRPVAVSAQSARPEAPVLPAKPASAEEAYATIASTAEFLRHLNSASVAPYLLVRSLRWAELRNAGDDLDASLLVAPSTEMRQNLRRLFLEKKWDELLSATEGATALPCGRAWLDLHHYAWLALGEQCHSVVAKAICSELRALVADFPSLPDSVLDDGTPVANPDTKSWLAEHILPPKKPEAERLSYLPARREKPVEAETSATTNGAADPFETALQLARNQEFPRAIELITRQRLPEDSGRERFLRQLKISHLCLATGQFTIAYAILRDLFSEIEQRKLLEWESTGFLVEPLSLLVQCIDKTNQGKDQRAEIYNLLCRLEPTEALKLQSS